METTQDDARAPAHGVARGDRAAGLVEYALLLALIAVACLVSLQAFGLTNGGSINNTASSYGSAVN